MNFNYSYRSLLITSLLFGILFTILFGIKLSSEQETLLEKYDIEYSEELLIPEEEEEQEDLAVLPKQKIETHRAFNEAEKFISNVENEREDPTETTEGKMASMEAAIENATTSNNKENITASKKKEIKKEAFSSGTNKNNSVSVTSSSNRNSTNSYRLVNRKAMYFPNPVYICDGYGTVVINIEVSDTGKVIKTSYNSKTSTTTNECLIDIAIEYAEQTRFSTDADKLKQLGTITYNFPGQQ